MDKLAMVKLAEVNGVIAGLVDEGLVKVASEEEFNALCDLVSDDLDDSYDLEDVLNKTAEIVEVAEALDGELEKEASDAYDTSDILAAYGELTLLKEAGEIDDDTYDQETGTLKKYLNKGKGMASDAWEHVKAHKGGYATAAAVLAALGYAAQKGKLGFRKGSVGRQYDKIKKFMDKKYTGSKTYLTGKYDTAKNWTKDMAANAADRLIANAAGHAGKKGIEAIDHPYRYQAKRAVGAGLGLYGGYKGIQALNKLRKGDED